MTHLDLCTNVSGEDIKFLEKLSRSGELASLSILRVTFSVRTSQRGMTIDKSAKLQEDWL